MSAGNRGSLQEKGNFCSIDGKSAGKRKVYKKKGKFKYYVMAIVCRKEGKFYSVPLLCDGACLKERRENCRVEDMSALKME
jgi:hypothetical protein